MISFQPTPFQTALAPEPPVTPPGGAEPAALGAEEAAAPLLGPEDARLVALAIHHVGLQATRRLEALAQRASLRTGVAPKNASVELNRTAFSLKALGLLNGEKAAATALTRLDIYGRQRVQEFLNDVYHAAMSALRVLEPGAQPSPAQDRKLDRVAAALESGPHQPRLFVYRPEQADQGRSPGLQRLVAALVDRYLGAVRVAGVLGTEKFGAKAEALLSKGAAANAQRGQLPAPEAAVAPEALTAWQQTAFGREAACRVLIGQLATDLHTPEQKSPRTEEFLLTQMAQAAAAGGPAAPRVEPETQLNPFYQQMLALEQAAQKLDQTPPDKNPLYRAIREAVGGSDLAAAYLYTEIDNDPAWKAKIESGEALLEEHPLLEDYARLQDASREISHALLWQTDPPPPGVAAPTPQLLEIQACTRDLQGVFEELPRLLPYEDAQRLQALERHAAAIAERGVDPRNDDPDYRKVAQSYQAAQTTERQVRQALATQRRDLQNLKALNDRFSIARPSQRFAALPLAERLRFVNSLSSSCPEGLAASAASLLADAALQALKPLPEKAAVNLAQSHLLLKAQAQRARAQGAPVAAVEFVDRLNQALQMAHGPQGQGPTQEGFDRAFSPDTQDRAAAQALERVLRLPPAERVQAELGLRVVAEALQTVGHRPSGTERDVDPEGLVDARARALQSTYQRVEVRLGHLESIADYLNAVRQPAALAHAVHKAEKGINLWKDAVNAELGRHQQTLERKRRLVHALDALLQSGLTPAASPAAGAGGARGVRAAIAAQAQEAIAELRKRQASQNPGDDAEAARAKAQAQRIVQSAIAVQTRPEETARQALRRYAARLRHEVADAEEKIRRIHEERALLAPAGAPAQQPSRPAPAHAIENSFGQAWERALTQLEKAGRRFTDLRDFSPGPEQALQPPTPETLLGGAKAYERLQQLNRTLDQANERLRRCGLPLEPFPPGAGALDKVAALQGALLKTAVHLSVNPQTARALGVYLQPLVSRLAVCLQQEPPPPSGRPFGLALTELKEKVQRTLNALQTDAPARRPAGPTLGVALA